MVIIVIIEAAILFSIVLLLFVMPDLDSSRDIGGFLIQAFTTIAMHYTLIAISLVLAVL